MQCLIAGIAVSNPAGCMDVCLLGLLCAVVGIDKPITRSQESYRVLCLIVWDIEISTIFGCCATQKDELH